MRSAWLAAEGTGAAVGAGVAGAGVGGVAWGVSGPTLRSVALSFGKVASSVADGRNRGDALMLKQKHWRRQGQRHGARRPMFLWNLARITAKRRHVLRHWSMQEFAELFPLSKTAIRVSPDKGSKFCKPQELK